jgi:glycosyltransferase involved in cell wall biosynthesis
MAMSSIRIAHLTSAHPRDDVRIFHKECKSLATAGYDVHLVVADNLGVEQRDGVTIHDVGKRGGRLARVIGATRRVLKQAQALDADIYHLHDPELLWAGLLLSKKGRAVIFDAHEDVSLQLLNKPYLTPIALKIIAQVYATVERFACGRFSGIVAATPFIGAKFRTINPRTVEVCNYPILKEFSPCENWDQKPAEVCYVGGLSGVRGIRQLVAAMALVRGETRLNLVGGFSEPALHSEVQACPGWERVNEYGVQDRVGVSGVYARSRAGLVTLLPIPNYLDALPIKMFEYMSAGIPVIASNFALWREIVDGNSCGLCVDPENPAEIASAVDYLMANPVEARTMGENGRQAVLSRYNWRNEEMVLIDFYRRVASTRIH